MALSLRHAIALVGVLVGALGTARLGWWQLDRAAQKVDLQRARQSQRLLPPLPAAALPADAAGAAAQLYRSTLLQGRWQPSATVYLENRQMNAQPGFFALTPLLLDDGTAVLVQRGWLARDAQDRTRIVLPPLPAGPVQVLGHIAPGPSRLYDFAGAASGPIRQNLEIDAFARETGLRLRPFSVVQDNGAASLHDGLLRQWYEPGADVSRHNGYAFQWFALSALIIGLYVWFQHIRPRRQRRA